MLSKKLNDALNAQFNHELEAAYLYLSMAIYFEKNDLPGFANWMRIQVKEEQFHAMKFHDYLLERDGEVVLTALKKPANDFKNVIDVFERSLEHEEFITAKINDIMKLAIKENDFATVNFLQWFIEEQVEEEATVKAIIAQLKMVDGKGQALLMFDREFAGRSFVEPQ